MLSEYRLQHIKSVHEQHDRFSRYCSSGDPWPCADYQMATELLRLRPVVEAAEALSRAHHKAMVDDGTSGPYDADDETLRAAWLVVKEVDKLAALEVKGADC